MPLPSGEKHQYHRVNSSDESAIDAESTTSGAGTEPDLVWRRRFYILLALSSTITTILFLAGATYFLRIPACPGPKPGAVIPYSPAPVKYVNKWLVGDIDTPKFLGQPRPEMDDAWHQLLSSTAIRLSAEELQLANNATSIEHQDGGYVAGLGVSHALHCVKRIKQYMHREYYYPGEQQWDELFSHADHCLESLRQGAMCASDVSIYTLEWTPHSRYKPAVRVPQPHACVDWEALHEWMASRAVSLDDAVRPDPSLYEDVQTDGHGGSHEK
ncbi:hypothetical protein GGR50DRAFT_50158 [Xylaria sp. CBS 124048]|nr:hypothetical protein GGR50DRAFT_50158 [Xylaria sp. CBS 124048]